MRGVFPILVTPFDEASRIDEASLRSLVDFNLDAGVHGLGVALGSEIFKLSEAERDEVTRIVVDQVNGRAPVVINTGAAGTDLAVHYSRRAENLGADALMVMPPSFLPVTADEVCAYFRTISDAVNIPIFIQDTSNVPVSAGLAQQIVAECRWVQYIKVESLPTVVKVADMARQAGDAMTIFGGAGGNYFIEEMRRGSQGTMPGCSQPQSFVKVWDYFQAGDEEAARIVFEREIVPVNRLAGISFAAFYHVHKEILRHHGVIYTAKVRDPGSPLDEVTRRELQYVIDRVIDDRV
jgi:4-hydroxy-tetrahydrodipicolinate synthase